MKYILITLVALAFFTAGIYTVKNEPRTEPAPVQNTSTEEVLPKSDAVTTNDTTPPPVREDGAHLDLSGQGLTRVPDSVFTRTNLTSLDLSDNKLTGALQAEVRKLTKLRTLDLSDNDFTGVPAEVGQLTQLEVLDLSNNPITGLPYEIGNLRTLQTLDLRGTQYSAQDLEVIRKTLPTTTAVLTD